MSWKQKYELSSDFNGIVRTLTEYYSLQGDRDIADLLAESWFDFKEPYYDGFSRGYIFDFKIYAPLHVYQKLFNRQEEVQKEISESLSKYAAADEHVDGIKILIMPDLAADVDEPSIPDASLCRIWKADCFRLFLSHKAAHKVETAKLKSSLARYGIDCFVAHEDIHPTEQWQTEIENALFSMDGFAALMTDDFHDSDWTDQEVGVAFGRRVPMIAIDLGMLPYGFIGKFQALRCQWEDVPSELLRLLIKEERMVDAYVHAVKNCESYDCGNDLAAVLPNISTLSELQVQGLVDAYKNSQVRDSYGFNGTYPSRFGPGLAHELSRITGLKYVFNADGTLDNTPF